MTRKQQLMAYEEQLGTVEYQIGEFNRIFIEAIDGCKHLKQRLVFRAVAGGLLSRAQGFAAEARRYLRDKPPGWETYFSVYLQSAEGVSASISDMAFMPHSFERRAS